MGLPRTFVAALVAAFALAFAGVDKATAGLVLLHEEGRGAKFSAPTIELYWPKEAVVAFCGTDDLMTHGCSEFTAPTVKPESYAPTPASLTFDHELPKSVTNTMSFSLSPLQRALNAEADRLWIYINEEGWPAPADSDWDQIEVPTNV